MVGVRFFLGHSVDNLLRELASSKVGCYFGHYFVGALAYADDIVLIAPTPSAMRKLLLICEDYAREYSILFNASKSKFLVVHPLNSLARNNKYTFHINNNPLEAVTSFVHLGHVISASITDDADIMRCRDNFIRQFNNMISYFRILKFSVLLKLFRSYCTSYYGCELWCLDNKVIDLLSTAWRKAIRRICNIPATAHNYLLPSISDSLPVFDEICLRSINFARLCLNHECNLVRFVANYCVFSCPGQFALGRNILFCSRRYCCSVYDMLLSPTAFRIRSYVSGVISKEESSLANLLRELLSIRDGIFSLPRDHMSSEEIQIMIDTVSCA